MSVLAYCVADTELEALPEGVQGMAVVQASVAGLSVFFSEAEFDLRSEESVREAALAFHRVNDAVFHAGGIVPFRFPTMLPSVSGLEAFIERNREVFESSLDATRDRVQMELWIYPAPQTGEAASASGRAYLQGKASVQRDLQRAAEEFRARIAVYTVEWDQAGQRDALRCYALVARHDVAAFRHAAEGSTGQTKFRVTGPWPPTKFMPLDRIQPLPPPAAEVAEL